MPKISIVIPIYNVQNYLRVALESVINQTLTDIEIVCVEDCSTDNSRAIVQEYAQKDSRIKLILNEKNEGAAVSRNRGIDSATGDYLMFLDPDDWFELNACELAYNQILANKNDFVMFCFYNYNQKSGKKSYETYQIRPFYKWIDCPDIKLWEVEEPFITAAFVVMQIYNKKFIDKYNIRYDEALSIGEDLLFYFNAIANSTSFSILKKAIYYYRRHKKSVSSKRIDLWKEIFKSRLKALEVLKKSEHAKEYLKSYLPYFVSSTIHWYLVWTKRNLRIRKAFYYYIHNLFISLRNEYGESLIKCNMHPDKVKKFDEFVNEDWKTHNYKFIISSIFSVGYKHTIYSNKVIITLLGIRFTVNKNKVDKILVKFNHLSVLKKIRSRGSKKKVVFLSCEISKWNATSLYRALEKSELFEPLVLVYPLIRVHNCEDFSQPSLAEQYNFYKEQGINVACAYKNRAYLKLEEFKPDIVFYQQSWSLPVHYKVEYVSKFALPCYFSYGCQILDSKDDYSKDFNKLLFKYFVESDLNIKRYESYNKSNSANCVVTGLPKLDAYLENKPIALEKYWKEPSKFKIIYAPHHSFENDGLNFATFKENGKFIQELAKKHPETTWIFKPHPRFRFALLQNNIMTEDEINEYYKTWEEIGAIYTSGEYFDVFKSSDLMITDCCSFLGEYLPSRKPLIRLLSPNAIKLNSYGEKLVSQYYISHNNEELASLFEAIVVNKNDYKKLTRLQLVDELMGGKESSGEKICAYLEEIVRKGSRRSRN